jgi:hypothetical protein
LRDRLGAKQPRGLLKTIHGLFLAASTESPVHGKKKGMFFVDQLRFRHGDNTTLTFFTDSARLAALD